MPANQQALVVPQLLLKHNLHSQSKDDLLFGELTVFEVWGGVVWEGVDGQEANILIACFVVCTTCGWRGPCTDHVPCTDRVPCTDHVPQPQPQTLYFAALLRLPRDWTRSKKMERAEMVLAGLGLGKCRDTIIVRQGVDSCKGSARQGRIGQGVGEVALLPCAPLAPFASQLYIGCASLMYEPSHELYRDMSHPTTKPPP